MREAIYESHGIITSAEKKLNQINGHRKAHSFAYETSKVAKKLTFRGNSAESDSEIL